jgi:hypothetical protein
LGGLYRDKTRVIEPEMLDIIAELDKFKGAWPPPRPNALHLTGFVRGVKLDFP